MIDEKRLLDEFLKLVRIDSPSRDEAEVSSCLRSSLEELGAAVSEDGAASATGGNAGNLVARFKGNLPEAPAMLLSAHMDTVSPGRGIIPVIREGIVYSEGETILGSDDKSGIAIIMEILRSLKEHKPPHCDIEVVFTVCEEVGLLGAKALDLSGLKASFGYALDSTESCSLVYAAPASNHLKFTIRGIESHAGLAPEKGISAIQLAAKAIAAMPLGRIDDETTANIGIIKGGSATNIVPGIVEIMGEARSHNAAKLKEQTNAMVSCIKAAVDENPGIGGQKAGCDIEISFDYPLMRLQENCKPLALAKKASSRMGMEMVTRVGGGGSDANIFNDKGIAMAILGTGMEKVHTNEEHIRVADLSKTAEFLMEIILENGRNQSGSTAS